MRPRTVTLEQEPGGCIVRPSWDPSGYARRAAEALLQHGWAVVKGALPKEQADELFRASERALADFLEKDRHLVGNRGPRRYSMGSASKTHHMAHWPEWRYAIDNPIIVEVLKRIFAEDLTDPDAQGEYVAIGGGGDLVLGDTDATQWLHVDLPRWEMYDQIHPPPGVGVNFAVHDVSCDGGAMRLVPDTHTMPFQMELLAPSTEGKILKDLGLYRVHVCPLEKGDVILRDLRLWHAGSPNMDQKVRHLPNSEYLAPWYADKTEGTGDHLAPRKSIPHEIWLQLSPYTQRMSSRAHAEEPLELGWNKEIILPQQYD